MQKPLMIVIAAGFLIAVIFMYFNRPGPCATIKEQTTQKLNLSVDVIKAKGALVIGGEKVQDVSDGAQKVGEHLMACCDAQHGDHPLPPDQYLACINGAKDYEAKIIQITNIIQEADTAKQERKTELVAEAKTAIEASANIVSQLGKVAADANHASEVGKIAEAAPPPTPSPPAPKSSGAKQYFSFDFNGKTLEELDKWEVIRPDADNYELEKDGLLIINSKAGGLADDNIPNLFRLKTAMPEGDWTATVKFSSEFLALNEEFSLALLQDKDHWTAARFYVGTKYGWDRLLEVGLWWHWAAEPPVHWEGWMSSETGPGSWNKFVSDNKLNQPIYLRLRRAGVDFIASSRLETSERDAWVTVNKIAELHISGKLVFGFAQASQGTGQTQVKVEWVKIETP
jgi:hypothetical protein